MAVLDALALGQPGLPRHRRVDLAGDEGGAGVARAHVDGRQLALLHIGPGEQDVEVELPHRAGAERDPLALEVGERRDRLVGDNAVAAVRIVDCNDVLQIARLLQIEQSGVDRAGDHVEAVGIDRREALLGTLHNGELDLDAALLEEALVARDVEWPKADPSRMRNAYLVGAGGRRCPQRHDGNAADQQRNQTKLHPPVGRREATDDATTHKISYISVAPTSAVLPVGSKGGATSTTSPPMRVNPCSRRNIICASSTLMP